MSAAAWLARTAVIAMTTLGGCCAEGLNESRSWPGRSAVAPPPPTPARVPVEENNDSPEGAAPSTVTLVRSHAHELSQLPTLVSSGILEVTWRDDRGSHFEQGDLDLRFRGPDQLSLRLSKVGETQFLGGCNASQWWWYEGWTKPTRLSIGERRAHSDQVEQASADTERTGPPIEAHELLTILSLRPFDHVTRDRPARLGDDGAWIVELDASESPLELPTRLTFVTAQAPGAVGWSLRSLEVLDAAGTPQLTTTYEAHRRIERRGVATGDWPILPTRIRIVVPTRNDRPGFEWLVELDRPSATGERIVERLFELEAVRASVRAEVVEEVGGSGR